MSQNNAPAAPVAAAVALPVEPPVALPALSDADRLRRWRLVLGRDAAPSCGTLTGTAGEIDRALAALYQPNGPDGLSNNRKGGRGGSAPGVAIYASISPPKWCR